MECAERFVTFSSHFYSVAAFGFLFACLIDFSFSGDFGALELGGGGADDVVVVSTEVLRMWSIPLWVFVWIESLQGMSIDRLSRAKGVSEYLSSWSTNWVKFMVMYLFFWDTFLSESMQVRGMTESR